MIMSGEVVSDSDNEWYLISNWVILKVWVYMYMLKNMFIYVLKNVFVYKMLWFKKNVFFIVYLLKVYIWV